MKKTCFLLLFLNSVLAFAQFGPKVTFSRENKIKYEILSDQLNIDLKILSQKNRDQKERLKLQDGSISFINYQQKKDSLCNVYVNNVAKLVDPDQVH